MAESTVDRSLHAQIARESLRTRHYVSTRACKLKMMPIILPTRRRRRSISDHPLLLCRDGCARKMNDGPYTQTPYVDIHLILVNLWKPGVMDELRNAAK